MPSQPQLATLDILEPRMLLTATQLLELPDARFTDAGQSTEYALDQYFDDPAVTGSTVQVQTPLGSIAIETFDTITPITAGNFIDLIAASRYEDMFFHRSAGGFVLQGGGFTFPEGGTSTASVVNNGTIVNEFDNWFDAELGGLQAGDPVNVRGTLAMAKLEGDPDSATSQWFISVDDNQDILDPQNGGFTVFAQVLYDGMDIVDDLMQLDVVNAGGAFGTLPVINLDPNATSIERENLVLTETLLVEELTFTLGQQSHPNLITAEIVDGQLVLTTTAQAASESGYAIVEVIATDLGGNQVTQTIEVALDAPNVPRVDGPVLPNTSPPTITWEAAAGAETYDLWVNQLQDDAPNITIASQVVREDEIAGTSFTPEAGVLADGQYRAWVRSNNDDGTSGWSDGFLFYVGLEQPDGRHRYLCDARLRE